MQALSIFKLNFNVVQAVNLVIQMQRAAHVINLFVSWGTIAFVLSCKMYNHFWHALAKAMCLEAIVSLHCAGHCTSYCMFFGG